MSHLHHDYHSSDHGQREIFAQTEREALPACDIPETLAIAQGLSDSSPAGRPLVRTGEWLLALGNAGVAVPEFLMAVKRQAGVAAMDSLHNWFDLLGYLKQLRLIAMANSEDRQAFSTESRFAMWGAVKKWLAQTKKTDEAKLEKSSFALISMPAIGCWTYR